MASSLTDLVEPGQPQCGATPPGKTWPVCARPPQNHGGKHGRHESADFVWNDRGWFAHKESGTVISLDEGTTDE